MKKVYIAALMALAFSLTACGSAETIADSEASKASEEQVIIAQEVQTDCEEKVADPGYVFCTKEEVVDFFTTVELTKDNWSDYLEIRDVECNAQDPFGDIATYRTDSRLELKDDINVAVSEDFAIELSYHVSDESHYIDKETGEVLEKLESSEWDDTEIIEWLDYCVEIAYLYSPTETYYNSSNVEVGRDFYKIMSNIHVTRIQGTITMYDIPEDKWNTDEVGDRFIAVEHTLNDGGVEWVKLYEDGDMASERADGNGSSWETASAGADMNPSRWDLSKIE